VVYVFGNYELDVARRELRMNGERVETEPKAFELLTFLVTHADRAISKDELQNELWPRSIVTETALTRAVMKARRAVGDDANQQTMIRTVHGHGYRFVAELDGTADSLAENSPAPRMRGWRRPYARYAIIALVLGIVATALVSNLRTPPHTADGPVAVAVLPISSDIVDESLAWVRLGLMSLMNRMLEDGGVLVAPDRDVLTAVGDGPVPRPLTPDFLDRMFTVAAANHVLDVSLQFQNGLYRMSAVLAGRNGARTRRVIVGDTPAAVAADMSRVISGVLDRESGVPARRLQRVSADPFINEAYARALDLELQGRLAEARTLFGLAAEQEPELFWLRYEIALCTRDLREWDEAAAMFAALEQEARAAGDNAARLATLNSLGVMHIKQQDFAAAARTLGEAVALDGAGVTPSDRASVLVNLALVASNNDDRETARGYYAQALAAYRDAEMTPPPSFLNNFAGLLISEGQLSLAQEYSEEAITGFQLRGQRRFEASALNRLGKILRRRGDIDGAMLRHQQALAIQRDLGDKPGEIGVLMAITNVYRAKGDLTRARLNAKEVRDEAIDLNDQGLLADAHMFLAQAEEDLGNHSEARQEYVAAHNIFIAQGKPPGLRYADEGVARTTFRLGDREQAMALAEDLLESAQADSDVRAVGRAQRLIAEIEFAAGRTGSAIDRLLQVLEDARARGDELMEAGVTPELADAYLKEGMTAQAAELVGATNEPESSDPVLSRLQARLAFAQGEPERAVAIMSALRNSAGESWSDEDDVLLETFSEAYRR
jgi:DNA-binding winged helix-turn-helix (wHTH) protein/tetratricopeptide (TPR) repeat protein